ncbi:low-specificity L-threonine aldolase [Fictibacillus phosphorivorans]|uniref:low-specificity L-threonine aldolase n=1 Tax=Fictibacillus phosphorivorans TaxID=1221500 RepID=UPI0020407985|nr:low-specificity L-threonine aldolase [Fictibacillus phosphorivorans]MCM3719646.1 low-specificity L-threonine aldolase [Fictibacillus phosphorivorans]MCM3777280.1 low-specificity L-threonine aldolase [Fictibacillus phosphorivorans]
MIDLRSDTLTQPTKRMRQAIYEATVGDDVYGEDPTVNKLEELAAEILGKEDALFVTSGTQGNQLAVLSYCSPGDEIIVEAESHIFYYEGGGISALAGVQPRVVTGHKGAMDPKDVKAAIRSEDIHFPDTSLICLENTHNRSGGSIVLTENMKDIFDVAKQASIPVHIDGARLFNAAVASNKKVIDYTQYCDSVQICLSKGLGSPVGSLLAGKKEMIKKARKWRKRLGGGLRQAGFLAASGIISLTEMVDRLAEDHEKALRLANAIEEISGLTLKSLPDTNIVILNIEKTNKSNEEFLEDLKREGVLGVSFGEGQIRLTTHYDVSFEDIEEAISALKKIA